MATAQEFLNEAPEDAAVNAKDFLHANDGVSARDFLNENQPASPFSTDYTPQAPVNAPVGPQPSPPAIGIADLPERVLNRLGQATATAFNEIGNTARKVSGGTINPPQFESGKSVIPQTALDYLTSKTAVALDAIAQRKVDQPRSAAATGLSKTAEKAVSSITTPGGLVTLPLFEYRAGRAAFLALQAMQTPAQLEQTHKVLSDPASTPAQKWEAVGDAGLNLATIGALGLGVSVDTFKALHTPEEAAKIAETKTSEPTPPPELAHNEPNQPAAVPAPAAPVASEPVEEINPIASPTEKSDNKPIVSTASSLRDALDKFEGTGEIQTVQDLANEVHGLITEGKAPEELLPAVEKFHEEVRDDFKRAGRGDLETAEKEFLDEVRKHSGAPSVEKATAVEAQPPAELDLSPIHNAKTKDEVYGAVGQLTSKAKSADEIRSVRDSGIKRINELERQPTTPIVDQPVNKTEQRYKIGKSPQTYTVVDRPEPTELEKSLGEAPVNVKNEKTGEVQTVKESDLTSVNTAPPKSAQAKAGLDDQLREAKLDPSVFNNSTQKRAALKREKAMQSLGGQNPADPGEISKSEMAQLRDAVKGFSEKPDATPARAFDIGKSIASAKDSVSSSLNGLKAIGQFLKIKLEGKPVFSDFKRILGDRHLALSESAIEARRTAKDALLKFPDKTLQEAFSNWVDTGGEESMLKQARDETPDRYKAGYERALNLTDDEKTFAKNLQNYFESRLQDAQEAGIIEDGIENYIHRMYERENQWKQGILAELRSGIFTGKPALAKKRVFEYDFEAEKAGMKPVKSFIKRVAAYDLSLNKAIADRAAVKAMMEIKMPDGRPMIDVAGIGTKIDAPDGTTDATLINPSFKPEDTKNPKNNRADFRHQDFPALRKWKWVGKDDNGKPIYLQGDVLIHPDAIPRIKALFERSAIRQNPVGRAMLAAGATVKQTMLSVSGFHPVQIGVHGFEHRTFRPVKEIDFTNPDVRGLIRGGLVVGETTGRELFDEGLTGSSLTRFIPWAGPKLEAYNNWLFNSYIPRLKVATGLHALERNAERFPNLSKDDVMHMTANQMNNAFGELNYAMLGRSQTMQDALRIALLAPDFLEARSGFVGQAATKYGREQLVALAYGAGALYLTARILNQALTGQAHLEPKNAFNVVYNGKAYSLRTIQGDLIHAATDFPSFVRNRLNPVWGRTMMEAMSGRDAFGRKRDAGQQLTDAAKTAIPISAKGLFAGREQNLFESVLNAFGVTEHRESPLGDIYKKAQEWKTQNKIAAESGEFIYDAEKDPYRQIRLAAQYSDVAAVRSEIGKAESEGLTRAKIVKHFQMLASHPFTGSKANDAKFTKSLSNDEKKTLADAMQERKNIRQAVTDAFK